MRMSFAGAAAAFTVAAAVAVPAAANVTILQGNLPQNPDEELQLNSGATATMLVGTTSITGTEVDIAGTEPLWQPTQGQSRVLAWDQGLSSFDLTLADPHLGFTAFEFNLWRPHSSGLVSFTVYDQFGNTFGGSSPYTLASMGQNRFNITASAGELITRISFVTTADLQSVRDIRLSGVTSFGAAPEPAAWALMLAGFGGMGFVMRRRRAQLAFAAV